MKNEFIELTTGTDNPRPILINVSNIATIKESATNKETIITLNFATIDKTCTTIMAHETLSEIKVKLGI